MNENYARPKKEGHRPAIFVTVWPGHPQAMHTSTVWPGRPQAMHTSLQSGIATPSS